MPYPDSAYEQQWREARDNAPFVLVPVHSGHTPGPWHANGCCIEAPGDEGPRDVTIAVVHGQRLDADARLIAAAPELLNALRLCLEMEDGPNGHPCYCDEQHFDGGRCHTCTALSAIAKSEGRE